MFIYCSKYSTVQLLLQEQDEDDSCPVQAIHLHLPQSSLRGRDIAGTCRSFLIIMFSSTYTNVIICNVFQNIRIMYERFLTISYSRIKDTSRVDDLMRSEYKLLVLELSLILTKPSVAFDKNGPKQRTNSTTTNQVFPW